MKTYVQGPIVIYFNPQSTSLYDRFLKLLINLFYLTLFSTFVAVCQLVHQNKTINSIIVTCILILTSIGTITCHNLFACRLSRFALEIYKDSSSQTFEMEV